MWILYLLTNLAINVQYEIKNKDYILTNVPPAPPPQLGEKEIWRGEQTTKFHADRATKSFAHP